MTGHLVRAQRFRPFLSFLRTSNTNANLSTSQSSVARKSEEVNTISFGQISNELNMSARSKPTVLKDAAPITQESYNIDEFIEKAERLLKSRHPPDFKLRPVLSKNLRSVLQNQPSNRNYWLSLLIDRSDVFAVSPSLFPNIEYLSEFFIVSLGFSKRATFNLLSKLPAEFIFAKFATADELEAYWNMPLSNWLALCDKLTIDRKEAISILATMPEILGIDPHLWDERLDDLKEDYFKEKSSLKHLIMNAGAFVMLDSWSNVKEKLDYFVQVMHVDIRDLVGCGGVLYHDLAHVRNRFLFLDRAGLYKHPSAKSLGSSKSAFPLVAEVVGGTDQEFLEKVKINGSNEEMLRAAAEQFGDKTVDEVMFIARETLEGYQRAIMGTMSVEQIYRDRKVFSSRVFEVASTDLAGMGIVVISYTIKEVSDEVGYLKSLGLARTSEVQRDARIGEASAKMSTTIKEAIAGEELMKSKLSNDTEIARSKRNYDVKKAEYDAEVNTARAAADLAYDLKAAVMQQRIKEEGMQIQVIERLQEIEIAEHEIQRKHFELDSHIRKPAEAEKYRLETIAEAQRLKIIMEAEAEAEAVAIKGEAEAFAIEAMAKAEAEQMAKKADAWKEYKEAAIVDMMLQVMPKIAAEIAAPMAHANKITMISDGSGKVGPSRITTEILNIMKTIPEAVTAMTGIELNKHVINGIV